MYNETNWGWPFFDRRHGELAESVARWAARRPGPIEPSTMELVDAECRQDVADLGQAGLLSHVAGERDGHRKPDVRSLCLIREILARRDGLLDFAFALQGLGCGPVTLFGDNDQRERYLTGVCRGDLVAGFALSEKGAGSDVAALETHARKGNAGYVLNGAKTWISNGGVADFYTVFARTEGQPGSAAGISAFVVDASNPGLQVAERIQVNVPHPLATLTFVDCQVPETARIGDEGDGFKIAMSALDVFRPSVGAAALGLARRAFDLAVEHAAQRRMFGKMLGDFQLTRAKIAQMSEAVDAAALLVYRAAWAQDCENHRATREAAVAKLYATEAAQQVVDATVQLFGGLGVKSGHPAEKLYREVRSLRIYEGASEIQQLIIAREIMKATKDRER